MCVNSIVTLSVDKTVSQYIKKGGKKRPPKKKRHKLYLVHFDVHPGHHAATVDRYVLLVLSHLFIMAHSPHRVLRRKAKKRALIMTIIELRRDYSSLRIPKYL